MASGSYSGRSGGLHDARPIPPIGPGLASSISSVRESELPVGLIIGATSDQPESGTGTTCPQSGHLPASGRLDASTFSRRPHGQRNRMKPSSDSLTPTSDPADRFRRRSRIRAPHRGQSIRSGPLILTSITSPQRQVTRAMSAPGSSRVLGEHRLSKSGADRASTGRLLGVNSPRGSRY